MAKIKIEGVLGEKKDGFQKVFFRNYQDGEEKNFMEIKITPSLTVDPEKTNYIENNIGLVSTLHVNTNTKIKVKNKATNQIETMTVKAFAQNYEEYKPGTVSPLTSFAAMNENNQA
jgi:hypothetical protein